MLPWLIPAGLSLLGALGGSQKSKTTQTTTPQLDPAYGPLQQALLSQTLGRLNSPTALPAGYAAQGIGGINDTYKTIQQGIGNRAASLGQSGGAGELYALGNADIARGGDIAKFRTGLPLLERDMKNQDLAAALGVLNGGRYSSTTTGTSGGGVGGALEGAGGILGYLYGQGMLGGAKKSPGSFVASPANGTGPLPGGFGGNADWWNSIFG